MSPIQGTNPPRWVLVGWVILLLSLASLLFWARGDGQWRDAVNTRLVYSAMVRQPADEVASCLRDGLPLTGHWHVLSNLPQHWQGWNPARHLRVDLEQAGEFFRVTVGTPMGRPLRDQEALVLRRCLKPVQRIG